MGILDKMKNLFTEEVEEEEVKKKPIKKEEVPEIKKEIFKEERTVEIAPARKETVELLEKEEVKEERHTSPLYFSDEDFEDLPTRKEVKEEPKEDKMKPFHLYQGNKKEVIVEKKSFKPSPIISPVYGILDKNYSKDDIKTVNSTPVTTGKVTLDDVRTKAYGKLEDELEHTLASSIVVNNDEVEKTAIDIFDELDNKEENKKIVDNEVETAINEEISNEIEKQKEQIEEINEIIKTNISTEKKPITNRKIDNILEELDEIEELIPTKKEEVKEETHDDLDEGDLFNLIDSMYEKRND